jgi:Mn-containing catalase
VTRLYALTDDPGVRDMLSFLIARDSMHQNQWLAAIEELEHEGYDRTPVPASFPRDRELGAVAYEYLHCSDGRTAAGGRWATGPAPDGQGTFSFVEHPEPAAEAPDLAPVDVRLHGTPPLPVSPAVG